MSSTHEDEPGPSTVASEEPSAIGRLATSRAHLRAAMQAYIQAVSPPSDPARDAHRALGQRLLDRVHRLPVVRTVMSIRSLRRR